MLQASIMNIDGSTPFGCLMASSFNITIYTAHLIILLFDILPALGLKTFQFEISPCGCKPFAEPFSTCTLIDTYRILGEKLSSANDAVSILMPMTVRNLRGKDFAIYLLTQQKLMPDRPRARPSSDTRPCPELDGVSPLDLPPFFAVFSPHFSFFCFPFFSLLSFISFSFPCRFCRCR